MPTAAPLQILIFRHPDDPDTLPFEKAVVQAFQGSTETLGYAPGNGDLGIQLEVFSTVPRSKPQSTLDAFSHTLILILVDTALLDKGGDALWDWIAGAWDATTASNGRHRILVVPMEERIGRKFSIKRTALASLQLLQIHDLGETAIRPAMLSLRLLHESRVLLATALPSIDGHPHGFLKLFISHAKMDGLPLAHALKHQIQALGWLQNFYDVDDLPGGCDWQKELERGVGSSLIIILRTEMYDSRHWCRQEVLWADEYATPAVLVDARTGLNHPAGALPLDRIPTARIPDGNLIRILFLALREGLRFLYFARHVEQMKESGVLPSPVELRVFSFPPSMSALLRTCRILADSKEPPTTSRLILYPDPTLRSGVYEASHALVAAYAPAGTRLVTPFTLAASTGSTP